MAPAPAPVPLARRKRGFPVRQPKPEQFSLPGLIHALEVHPELPELLRPVIFGVRRAVAEYRLRADAIDAEVIETHALEACCSEGL